MSDLDIRRSFAVPDEPAAEMTASAGWKWEFRSRSKYLTPTALRPSITISHAIEPVRTSQLPVRMATGITVFCVPFLASHGQM